MQGGGKSEGRITILCERERERESVRDVTFYDMKYCYAYWCAEVKKYSMLFSVVRERLCIRWSFW